MANQAPIASPEELVQWLKDNDAPIDVLRAAQDAIIGSQSKTSFGIVLDNLLDHPAADEPSAVEFGSHVPGDVKAARAIALRICSDPRLRIELT